MMICSQHPMSLFPHAYTHGEDCPGPGVDVWAWIRRAEREIASLRTQLATMTQERETQCHCTETWRHANVDLRAERDEARRGADLLQQFSHELGEALQLRGDGTLTLSQAVLEKFAKVCDERDDALARIKGLEVVVEAAPRPIGFTWNRWSKWSHAEKQAWLDDMDPWATIEYFDALAALDAMEGKGT
jgi:hypothetical protein